MSASGFEALLARLRPAQGRVDLTRLAENYRRVAGACRVPVMPVVKADAYGHGAGPVARRLEALGAPMLAVAYPEGGAALREAGVRMDLTMVDVTTYPEVVEGDEAVLFGDDPTVWEVADRAGSNAWPVLTSVGPRVPRVYVEEGRIVDVESRYR